MEFVTGPNIVSRESVDEVFLPDKDDCLEYLREQRWLEEVTCPHSRSADTIKKGTTRKGAQRCRCHNRDSIFNNLTETIFFGHKLSLPEIFHTIRGIEEDKTAEMTQELDRTYRTVLNFVIKSKMLLTTILILISLVSAKLTRSMSWLVRNVLTKISRVIVGLKRHGTFKSDKPPVVTLVCCSDGRVLFLVREYLEDVDEDIVEYGDEDDLVTLCIDQYSIYDELNEYDEIDAISLSITTNTTSSVMLTQQLWEPPQLPLQLEGSETSQNTTYRVI